MTVFQSKWRDWTPEPAGQTPGEGNSGTFGTGSPIRTQTSTRGLIQQQQQQQQTNVINDFLDKGAPADIGLHIHTDRGAKSAINKGPDGGEEAPRRPLPTPAWDPEIAALIEWFNRTFPPPEPFELHQGVTILRPEHFWQYLKDDIAGGPGMGRARMGAFQKDLRRLAQLFGRPVPTGGTPDAP
jgi:hypothetical protein